MAHSMPGAGVVHHITSVVLSNRQLPVNFRYAPFGDRDRAAVQYVAKGNTGLVRCNSSLFDHLVGACE
jgi:hypothetical protein